MRSLFQLLTPPEYRPVRWRLLVILISIGAAAGLRFCLDSWLGENLPFAFFLLAVVVSAWFGGMTAGLAATAIACVLVLAFFLEPHGQFAISESPQALPFVLFLTQGTFAALLCGLLHYAISESRSAWRKASLDFEHMANHAAVLIWSTDAAGRTVFVNRSWLAFTGRSMQAELSERTSGIHPKDVERTQRAIQGAMAERKPYQIEYRLLRADGVYRWLLENVVPRFGRNDAFEGYIGSCIDITPSRDEHEKLAFMVELHRALAVSLDFDKTVEVLVGAVVPSIADWCFLQLTDEQGHLKTVRIHSLNPQVSRKLEEMEIGHWVFGEDTEGHGQILRDGEPCFVPSVTDDFIRRSALTDEHREQLRSLKLLSYVGVPLWAGGRIFGVLSLATGESGRVLGTDSILFVRKLGGIAAFALENARLYQNVNAALAAEEEARREREQSEHRFRFLANAMPQFIWTAQPDGCFDYVNQRWPEFTGVTTDELLGPDGWLSAVLPEDREEARNGWAQAVSRGSPWEASFRMQGQGKQPRWHLVRALPRRSADGGVEQWVGSATDIDALRRTYAEIAEARELLHDRAIHLEALVHQRTARLKESHEGLEAFSYSISHDLRAPVKFVRGFAEAIREDPGNQLTEESHGFLQRILKATARMDQLIQDLHTYSRLSRTELQIVSQPLDSIVAEVIAQHQPEIERIGAHVVTEGPLPSVLADRTGLTQALTNLLGNALKFRAPKKTSVIRIHAESGGGRARLWIEDNGIGIDPRHHERIFHIFERLHSNTDFPGSGMGLSLVRKAVNRMDGSCGVESTLGNGARFWIEFATDPAEPKPEPIANSSGKTRPAQLRAPGHQSSLWAGQSDVGILSAS